MMTALRYIRDDATRALFLGCVESAMRDALRIQGVRAMESTRRAAAIHEAGHCAIHAITAGGQFWPPRKTRIWREPVEDLTVWLGETVPSPKAPPIAIDARTDPKGAVVFFARIASGFAAEWLFDGRDYRLGSSLDEVMVAGGMARALADVSGGDPEKVFDGLLQSLCAMLKGAETTVLCIARALESRRKLQGDELARLLRPVTPRVRP